MNKVLQLLLEGEPLNTEQMAEILNLDVEAVEKELKALEADRTILGWRPVLNPNTDVENRVRALIEVKITPAREGGFDRTADRISRFDEVDTCQLMSGAYDLMVVVKGRNLHKVATFVSEKLATIDGVLSTATHFILRSYKVHGYYLGVGEGSSDKPAVSP